MSLGRTIAVVPARGGSERIPRKNLLSIRGRPLLLHTLEQALRADAVDAVLVSTEDEEVAEIARAAGTGVVMRPRELASAAATTESVLLHVLDHWRETEGTDPDLAILLQCTSPVRKRRDIDQAVAQLVRSDSDSLFSACPDPGLFWTLDENKPTPLNYDPRNRKREQEMAPQYRENGSIYVFKPSILRTTGSRLGGRIAIYEMDPLSSFQVDSGGDAELIEWVLSRRPADAGDADWPDQLGLIVFDFDGVMTDNTVTVSSDGSEAVRCDRGDGWGIRKLRERHIAMVVLSTEQDPVVRRRCEKLKLESIQGLDNKEAALRKLLTERQIPPESVAYIGNDVNDLGCLRLVGLPVAVGDAHPDVIRTSSIVLSRPGGAGAVREFCDLVNARIAAEA